MELRENRRNHIMQHVHQLLYLYVACYHCSMSVQSLQQHERAFARRLMQWISTSPPVAHVILMSVKPITAFDRLQT